MKRVYHPTLSSWQDVPDEAAAGWKDAGWRLTRPDHVDDSEAPPVGEGYVAPAVPVEVVVEPDVEPEPVEG